MNEEIAKLGPDYVDRFDRVWFECWLDQAKDGELERLWALFTKEFGTPEYPPEINGPSVRTLKRLRQLKESVRAVQPSPSQGH